MAHYAMLDENNIVTSVIVGKSEYSTDWESYYGNKFGQTCKRTSYNTIAGTHKEGGIPFRKNYAGIGYTYDETRDAFISPKPYSSWILNESSCVWEAPIAMPDDGNIYSWKENTQQWEQVDINE